jgi:hypothetical protein
MQEENFLQENHDINPDELRDIMTGFLGQNYVEISKYDANIVSENQFLQPKKREFQMVAEKVFQEIAPHSQRVNHNIRAPHNVPHNVPQHVSVTQNIPPVDANQMEFSFDNSITAISINKRLDDIEKILKKLDKTVSSMVELLPKYETKNK